MQTQEYTTAHPPRLAYTREEAADILGQSPATVDRLAKRGLLHPSRATRRPMYPHWELERFLRETSEEISPKAKRRSEPRQFGEIIDNLNGPRPRSRGVSKARAASRPGRRKKACPQGSLSADGQGGDMVCQPDRVTAHAGKEAS